MKTKIKKIVLPMTIALIAIAGAFASNLSHQANTALVDRIGYVRDGLTCTATSTLCSTDFNEEVCSNLQHPILYDWNGTFCPMELYKRVE